MTSSRVEALALRIRTAEPRPGLAAQCETLVRRVLERLVERLDDGERVVLVRRLELAWRLPDRALDTGDTLERLTDDLVAALRPAWTLPLEPPDPDPDADLVVFANAAHWWADALLARAGGRVAWYQRPVLEPEPLTVLAGPDRRPLALAVLRRLGRDAPAALRGSPIEALVTLAEALGVRLPGGPLPDLFPAPEHRIGTTEGVEVWLAEVAAAGGSGAARAAAGLTMLALHLARVPAGASLEAAVRTLAGNPASASPRRQEGPYAGPEATPGTAPEPPAVQETPPLVAATACAGLCYLVTLWLELGTGEHLWQACLPEGRLLGWAAAGLVGDAPILAWLGGTDLSAPPVTPAQADEVIARGVVELARALVRRRPGVAVPDLELFLTGAELVATLPGSPFPVWSVPCATPPELRTAVALLAGCWPGRFSGPASLAALGWKSRFRVRPRGAPRHLFRRAGPEPAGRLASVLTGVASALFEWRIDAPRETSWEAFAGRWLRIPGRLERTADALVVHLRAADVAFPVRRAGLDRDPGYLPWLGCTLRLHFEGEEPSGDTLPVSGWGEGG